MKLLKMLETKILTDDLDEILLIKTNLPDNFKGKKLAIDGINRLPDNKFDLVVGENITCKSYHLNYIFKQLSDRLKENGILVLKELVCGSEDSWLNSLIYSFDSNHVRFSRPEEIISAASDYFEIKDFFKANYILTLNRNADAELKMFKIPDHILSIIDPEVEGNTVQLNVFNGLFIWKKINNIEFENM